MKRPKFDPAYPSRREREPHPMLGPGDIGYPDPDASIGLKLPDMSREGLESAARGWADDHGWKDPDAELEWAQIRFLLIEYTEAYDLYPAPEWEIEGYAVIAAAFPWLADECVWQAGALTRCTDRWERQSEVYNRKLEAAQMKRRQARLDRERTSLEATP